MANQKQGSLLKVQNPEKLWNVKYCKIVRIHIPTVLESRLQGRASAGFFLVYTSYIVPLQEPPAPPPPPSLLVAAALHM